RRSHMARPIPATVRRPRTSAPPAGLAVVDDPEVRAFTGRDEQAAVGAEVEVSDGMAWVLLAPPLDQHLLARRGVPRQREAREPALDDAAVRRRAGRRRAGVVPRRRRPARRPVVRAADVG